MRIGVDAGGTFTDFVVLNDDGRIGTFKLRSNPVAPASVILEGLRLARSERRTEVVHGSTVATNALLERKGARVALVTTRGFEDIIEIGRQNRRHLYTLNPPPPKAIVDPSLRFGIEERTYFDGSIAITPDAASVRKVIDKLTHANVESIAICFLHSYRNAGNERLVAAVLRDLPAFICTSSEICPEFREYERTSTTVLNAYVGPLMDRYLGVLDSEIPGRLAIMQSNGGLLTAAQARCHAVRTILSGPAGGVVGATRTAALAGYSKTLGFDMGGTSTDVSLADGRPALTMEGSVDNLPVRVPILDIHTVGAGGGSVARVDAGGLLRVGPESAGADPGPACYGKGDRATVTDAHVVLGRIAPDQLLGGAMPIYPERSERAIKTIALALGLSMLATAEAILRVANANMERAIRVISVERGHDPREFALVAFGGCGGLHACAIAEDLELPAVFIPRHAGVLSALGMLLADHVRDYSAGVLGARDYVAIYKRLEAIARKENPKARLERSCDVRYAGQSYEITVPKPEDFHNAHRKAYGYADPNKPIEIVALRVRAVVATTQPDLRAPRTRRPASAATRRLYLNGKWHEARVLSRPDLRSQPIAGPALLIDEGATALIPPHWTVRGDAWSNAVVEKS